MDQQKVKPGPISGNHYKPTIRVGKKKSTSFLCANIWSANAQSEAMQYYTIKSKMKIRTFTALADLDVDQNCHEPVLQIKKN